MAYAAGSLHDRAVYDRVFTTEPFTTGPFTTEPFTTEPHFRQRFDRAAVGDVRVAGRSSYWGQRV